MTGQRIIIVDTETTATDPALGSEPWEFAGVVVEAGQGRVDEGAHLHFHLPVNLRHANPQSLAIGKFWERQPDSAHEGWAVRRNERHGSDETYRPSAAARQIAAFLNGASIAGSNPGFDTAHLASFLVAHGAAPSWHYRPVDLYDQIAGGLAVMGRDQDLPVSRSRIMRLLGVTQSEGEGHTALGDCRREIEVWTTWTEMRDQYREDPTGFRFPGEREVAEAA